MNPAFAHVEDFIAMNFLPLKIRQVFVLQFKRHFLMVDRVEGWEFLTITWLSFAFTMLGSQLFRMHSDTIELFGFPEVYGIVDFLKETRFSGFA